MREDVNSRTRCNLYKDKMLTKLGSEFSWQVAFLQDSVSDLNLELARKKEVTDPIQLHVRHAVSAPILCVSPSFQWAI